MAVEKCGICGEHKAAVCGKCVVALEEKVERLRDAALAYQEAERYREALQTIIDTDAVSIEYGDGVRPATAVEIARAALDGAPAAWNRRAPEPEQGRVVKCRGAIGPNGEWYVCGWNDMSENDHHIWSDGWDCQPSDEQPFLVHVPLPEYQPPPVVRARTGQADG